MPRWLSSIYKTWRLITPEFKLLILCLKLFPKTIMIHNFIPKHYHNKQMNLTKINRHTSSDVYVDSDSGDEQHSINSKETSFHNIIKDNNSKTNSLTSHTEVSTSDLPSQYQTS